MAFYDCRLAQRQIDLGHAGQFGMMLAGGTKMFE